MREASVMLIPCRASAAGRTRLLLQLLAVIVLGCGMTASFAQAPPAAASNPDSKPARPLTLDDLFSEVSVVDAALSPSGRYLAVIVRRPEDDRLLVYDLTTGDKKFVKSVPKVSAGTALALDMGSVYWKSDDRLLCRLHVMPAEGKNIDAMPMSTINKMGDRLFAMNRDGTNLVMLLGDNREMALDSSFNLGEIASFLANDPNHVLME